VETREQIAAARLVSAVQSAVEAFDEIEAAALALRRAMDDGDLGTTSSIAVGANLGTFFNIIGFLADCSEIESQSMIDDALEVQRLVDLLVGTRLVEVPA
jgi:hypothetical protein